MPGQAQGVDYMPAAVNNPYLPPLFPRWNVAVMHLANRTNPRGWDVKSGTGYRLDAGNDVEAPATLEAQKAWVRRHGRVCVDGRHSLMTIYGDPEVNYAFRAWHEATHIRLNAPFTRAGEARVCAAQQADVAKLYGRREAFMFAHILHCEVLEQAEELERTGRFPADQRAFTLSRLDPAIISELGGYAANVERATGTGPVMLTKTPHGMPGTVLS